MTVGEIDKEEDGNIFGYWDKEIRSLMQTSTLLQTLSIYIAIGLIFFTLY